MTVAIGNYTLKSSDVEIVKVEGDLDQLEEIRAWVMAALDTPDNVPVTAEVRTMMGASIAFSYNCNGEMRHYTAHMGSYIAKDADNRVYTISPEIIAAFYTKLP